MIPGSIALLEIRSASAATEAPLGQHGGQALVQKVEVHVSSLFV
jgi:hypothetical protein